MRRLLLGFILGIIFLPAAASAGGAWVGSTSITSPFYTASLHHPGCGPHTSAVTRGYYGAYHERFRSCEMTFSRVYVAHFGTPTATPRPTHTPLPPILATPTTLPAPPAPSPSPVSASATPTGTPVPPTPVPTATAVPSSDPVLYELDLLNAARSQFGVAPLSLNAAQSAGVGTCVGSAGHSVAMAQSSQIWHVNPSYPAASFPNNICVLMYPLGENVGAGSVFGDPRPMLQQLHDSMMTEGTSNCGSVVSHACNIINPAFHQVGIGILVQNGNVWLTTDFLG